MEVTETRGTVSPEETERLAGVFASVFGKDPSLKFEERLNEKRGLSVLVEGEGEIRGFKVGYERFRGVFFSWLGGVIPEFRRRGIARGLLREQHRVCLDRGYVEIQTETYGDGNGMLLLNLSEGFEIYGTYLGDDRRLRVQLRKRLER